MSITKRAVSTLMTATALLVLSSGVARANSIVFTLNCSANAIGVCATAGVLGGPFGTVTLTDDTTDSHWVDISVNLTNGETLTRLFLNYGPAIGAGYAFSAGPTATVVTGSNNQGPAAYGLTFDIKIADNPSGNPYTTVLKLQKAASPDIDLNVGDFDIKDANNLLFAAVNHTGPGSQKGALADLVVNPTAPVPEPATLALLGLGLVGARLTLRKQKERH